MNPARSDTMKLHRPLALASLASLLLILAGCGGGASDGGGGGGGGGLSFPASGAYGWLLKASGPTSALKFGLSFIHPSRPGTEYVIEVARDVVSDARLVSSGSIDPAQLRATALQPHTLVYIVGGDVRSVPMTADGTAPAARIQRAQTTSACRFGIEGNDYAAPQNSRFIVSTAGADGQCDTSDDGRAEARLAATGALGYTPLSGELPLDVARDPATLAPRGWINPRSVVLWGSTPTTIATRTAPAAALTSVLASTPEASLVADGARLAVLRFGSGSTVTESALDPTITAGNGWQPIGFDADNFYAYINSSNTFTSTWRVVKIARATPTATLLATGTGLVTVASMGRNTLYLTVFGASDNRLIRIAKSNGAQTPTSTATTALLTMQTGADGVHQRWRVSGVGSATPSYVVDMVDETDTVLFSIAGGFPLDVAAAGTRNFNSSESRSRFLVAGNYGSRAFGDASLIGYDSATRTATTLGTLPGTSVFGGSPVYASASAGPTAFGTGFAARSTTGTIEETGAKVFSFDFGVAGSLTFTTLTQ